MNEEAIPADDCKNCGHEARTHEGVENRCLFNPNTTYANDHWYISDWTDETMYLRHKMVDLRVQASAVAQVYR